MWRLVVGIWLFASAALAAEPLRIDYRAPVGCPSQETLEKRIAARSSMAVMASPTELALVLTVTMQVREKDVLATLQMADKDDYHLERSFLANTCEEAVSAMALVIALALDARAEREPSHPTSPPSIPPRRPPLPAESRTPPRVSPPAHGQHPVPKHFMVSGLGVAVETSLGPSLALGAEAFFGIEREGGMAARLAVRTFRGHEEIDGRRAAMQAWLARLEACPLSWSPHSVFSLSPCGAFDLGKLDAWGVPSQHLVRVEETHLTYGSLLAVVRMRLVLTKYLALEAEGESGVVLNRRRFVFDPPRQTVFSMPRGGFGAALGLAFTLR